MDEHVEKMVKDDRLYDVQTVANIFNKAKKSLLEEKGVETSSTKAQQLVD
jgi:hypothetical protein